MISKTLKGHSSMFAANVLWGLNAPFIKMVLLSGFITALPIASLRMIGSAIVFWLASLFVPKEKVSTKDLIALFFASLLGLTLNQGLFTYGLSLTSPINSSIVATTSPIITMLIAAVYLKEPITGKKVFGVLLGAAGAVMLIIGGVGENSSSGYWIGDVLCLAAQCAFSLYMVLYKGLVSRYSPITVMKWMFLFAAICWLPFVSNQLIAIDFAAMPLRVYGLVAFVILGGTFFPYLFVPIGQKNLRPTVAVMYNYLQPIVATLLAVFWGLDTFGYLKGTAILLVFLGVYIVTRSKSRVEVEGSSHKVAD